MRESHESSSLLKAASPVKKRPTWKVIVTIFIVAPLALMTSGLCLLAVLMGLSALIGSGQPAVGTFLLALGALAVGYLYSLVASLWLDRHSASIILGLLAGQIILSIGVFNTIDDALGRYRADSTWSAKDYGETYGFGSIALAGWALTLFLLCRAAVAPREP